MQKRFKKLKFKAPKEVPESGERIHIAFVGRPNVGKSSLVNAFFGEEKVIVSDVPGTTRDATDIDFTFEDNAFTLIDTAGIRRRGSVEVGIEKFSVARSLQALDRADVAVLLLDASEGITRQDMHVADYVLKSGTGLIIAVNKIDLMEKGEDPREEWKRQLAHRFDFTPWAGIAFVSAKNRRNIDDILKQAKVIFQERTKRITTGELNHFLGHMITQHAPTGNAAGKPKAFYMTQVDVKPPHFVIFVNNKEKFHFSYARYLENRLREKYGFYGTTIRIDFRSKPVDETRPRRTAAQRKKTRKRD
jgi:GTP-binding protein